MVFIYAWLRDSYISYSERGYWNMCVSVIRSSKDCNSTPVRVKQTQLPSVGKRAEALADVMGVARIAEGHTCCANAQVAEPSDSAA